MTSPYAPPQAPPRQRRRGGVVGPLILIFIGGVFLLENTGYLPPNFWVNLWRLWPLILVLVGIELLLAHRVPWLALFAIGALVLVGGAVATNTGMPSQVAAPAFTTSSETDLGGASEAAIRVRFGAGQLDMGSIPQPTPGQLASMTYQGPAQLAPAPHYVPTANGVGQLDYQISGRPGQGFFPFGDSGSNEPHMELNLAPGVPITSLSLQTGATAAHIDLSSLDVSSVDMSIGAATTWVRFPDSGVTSAHISGGASTITIEVPQGVSAQITHHGGLSTLNVDQSRFPQAGDGVYRSNDYDTAQNRLDLTLETGVTTIQVS